MGQKKIITCKVEKLSRGPKNYLFGFHDLIISNSHCTKFLALEVDVINRPNLPGEQFGVGYIENNNFISTGYTTAMNFPQGSRQQWVGETDCFIVNNRVGDVWGTDLYDARTNKLLDRFEAAIHVLSKDGTKGYGLDYSRLFRLGGYGYCGLEDVTEKELVPKSSGITVLDLNTKQYKCLVSVKEVAEFENNKRSFFSPHYLTHLCLNPSATRVAFLHRYFFPDGGMMTRLMTIGTDGCYLRCLAQGYLSHFHWKDDNTIYIYGRANSSIDQLRNNPVLTNPLFSKSIRFLKKTLKNVIKENKLIIPDTSFLLLSDEDNPHIQSFAKDIIPLDGHPMTNPINNNWCVNDTYPNENGIRTLMLYNFEKDLRIDLGSFSMLNDKPDMTFKEKYFTGVDSKILKMIIAEQLAFTRSGLHCDLHPRWNADGTIVCFDSIHEGSRQIYSVDVSDILNAYN